MPPIRHQLSAYEAWAKASGASAGTIRLRRHHLQALAREFEPTPLLELATTQLVEYLGRPGWTPETRKSARSAIRSFFSWAVDAEQLDRDPARKLPAVRVPIGRAKPAPERIFEKALSEADARGRRLLLLAAYAGLRRAEIARVHSDDIHDGELRVVGKGGRTRQVPLHPTIIEDLQQAPDGWLFPGNDDGHLSPDYVGKLIKRMLGSGWTAHTLRHRFASRAYESERDLLAVQALLGHSKPETTKRYVAIPDGALKAAVMGIGMVASLPPIVG